MQHVNKKIQKLLEQALIEGPERKSRMGKDSAEVKDFLDKYDIVSGRYPVYLDDLYKLYKSSKHAYLTKTVFRNKLKRFIPSDKPTFKINKDVFFIFENIPQRAPPSSKTKARLAVGIIQTIKDKGLKPGNYYYQDFLIVYLFCEHLGRFDKTMRMLVRAICKLEFNQKIIKNKTIYYGINLDLSKVDLTASRIAVIKKWHHGKKEIKAKS